MTDLQLRKQVELDFSEFFEHVNQEELEVLHSIISGLKKKRNGEVLTYLNGITQTQSRQLENGDFEIVIPNTPLIKNMLGMTHGGMTATLLDTTLGTLVNLHIPKEKASVTTELKINYIRPSKGEYLRCVATLLHVGSKIAVLEGKVYDDNDQLIASGSGSFFIFNKKK